MTKASILREKMLVKTDQLKFVVFKGIQDMVILPKPL